MTDTEPTIEEIAAEAAVDLRAVETEAKKSFRLSDRIRGIKQITRKVVVFTNPEAAEKVKELQIALEVTGAKADVATDEAWKAELTAKYTELEEQIEAAKAELFESAIALSLRALPEKVLKGCRREARKPYELPDGVIPGDKAEEFRNLLTVTTLQKSLFRAVAPDGELELGPGIADELNAFLPTPQWVRLEEAMNILMFTDAIGDNATNDPGF